MLVRGLSPRDANGAFGQGGGGEAIGGGHLRWQPLLPREAARTNGAHLQDEQLDFTQAYMICKLIYPSGWLSCLVAGKLSICLV